jgi:pimeloyl-ACP methyl ester carboxylesterase
MKTDSHQGKKKVWKMFVIIVCCCVIVICVILPPSLGKTKPNKKKNGNVLENSISEKIHVDINDASLGMFIMAKDSSKPVLLFLSGGPGIPEYLMEQWYPSGLENEFVVCYPEYRGASLSYDSGLDPNSITLDQYIDDAVGITNYLRERFGQDKIYLMAHSFGTYIGINLADRHPELYFSYIAMSQKTDGRISEKMAYDYMYEQYTAQGNDKMIERFEKYPIHASEEAFDKYLNEAGGLRDTAMHDLGVGTTHEMRSVISEIFFPSLRCTAYTPMERINIWRGKFFLAKTPAGKGIWDYNAYEDVPEIDIPIYFFGGVYDYTCAYPSQKDYFEKIKAPLKAFYTFDNSAHSPLFEEPEKAMCILTEDVLAGRKGLADARAKID